MDDEAKIAVDSEGHKEARLKLEEFEKSNPEVAEFGSYLVEGIHRGRIDNIAKGAPEYVAILVETGVLKAT